MTETAWKKAEALLCLKLSEENIEPEEDELFMVGMHSFEQEERWMHAEYRLKRAGNGWTRHYVEYEKEPIPYSKRLSLGAYYWLYTQDCFGVC